MGLATLALAPVAQAHEKWFVSVQPPALEPGGFFSSFALSAAGVVAVVTAVAAFVWRKRNRLDLVPGPGRPRLALGPSDRATIELQPESTVSL